jgi:DnaK suppressor protein
MTDEETRARLEAERERLEQVRQGVIQGGGVGGGEPPRELSVLDQHPAEVGTETFDMERDQSLLEQVAAELDDVEAALQRLDQGTYGRCEACGGPIGEERLEAMPAARFCLLHQQLAEAES